MIKKLAAVILLICCLTVNACALNPQDISAECAVVLSVQSGEVVFEKKAYEKHSMASTTKIMTSLLAVESGLLPNEIRVTDAMVKVEGTSMGLEGGDSVSLEELVYGMLLSSGNDAANAVAVYLGGSTEAFSAMMNSKAKQIGMKNTNFVTPSGLDDDNHYSTAYDMALLGAYAVGNPKFLSICSARSAVLTYGNPPYRRTLTNHNRLLSYYEYALGIKTGFTRKSGRCLVSYAVKDGAGLVAVTLNDPNDWYDHKLMLESGFELLKKQEIAPNAPKTVPVVGGSADSVSVKAESFTLSSVNTGKITQKIYLGRFAYAPVSKGDVLGKAEIYNDGRLVGTVNLTAAEDVSVNFNPPVIKEKEEESFFKRIINKIRRISND